MDRLTQLEQENTQLREELEQEKAYYAFLKESSTAKISQQRNCVLAEVTTRIEHELLKLERCFNGKADSFAENSKMGLRIIGKIKDKISIQNP